jgi:NAD(P)-dependent dehydrogenase (short-subunit alcohol dehydrogenase family)
MQPYWRSEEIPDLTGMNAVVTGAGREVGRLIIQRLAEHGANVFAVSRDALPPGRFSSGVEPVRMNPTSMASIHNGASRIASEVGHVDILIHAASSSIAPRFRSSEGHDLMLATNYLGFVMLTHALAPAMRKSRSPRVVLAGPGAPLDADFDLERLDIDADLPWDILYTQSRIAAMIFALELNCRAGDRHSSLLSAVAEANEHDATLDRHHPFRRTTRRVMSLLTRTPADTPALPTLFASTSCEAIGGTYYAASGKGRLLSEPLPARLPVSDELRTELWQRTEDMLGLQLDVM